MSLVLGFLTCGSLLHVVQGLADPGLARGVLSPCILHTYCGQEVVCEDAAQWSWGPGSTAATTVGQTSRPYCQPGLWVEEKGVRGREASVGAMAQDGRVRRALSQQRPVGGVGTPEPAERSLTVTSAI